MNRALDAAYRAARYRVTEGEAFTLRVGEPSAALRRLYAEFGVDEAAFITACNPGSRVLDASANRRRMRRLAADVAALGLAVREGIGEDDTGTWREPSLLALGMPLPQARALGRKYGQNAIVWCGADAVPALVWL